MGRKMRLGIIAAVGALVFSGMAATPAMASGTGSALGSNGSVVSIYVDGTYNRVNAMEVGVIYPYAANTICNGYGRGAGTRTTGAAWSKTWGNFSGCLAVQWISRTSVGLDFKSGTNMSVRAFHDGQWNAGVPTLAIQ